MFWSSEACVKHFKNTLQDLKVELYLKTWNKFTVYCTRNIQPQKYTLVDLSHFCVFFYNIVIISAILLFIYCVLYNVVFIQCCCVFCNVVFSIMFLYFCNAVVF